MEYTAKQVWDFFWHVDGHAETLDEGSGGYGCKWCSEAAEYLKQQAERLEQKENSGETRKRNATNSRKRDARRKRAPGV